MSEVFKSYLKEEANGSESELVRVISKVVMNHKNSMTGAEKVLKMLSEKALEMGLEDVYSALRAEMSISLCTTFNASSTRTGLSAKGIARKMLNAVADNLDSTIKEHQEYVAYKKGKV